LTLDAKPFARPISILDRHTEQIVSFPVDDESSANGIVSLSWHGPYISNLREIVALDLVLNFLSNSSISALHSHFIDKQSYVCSLVVFIINFNIVVVPWLDY
jgi:Zn-dependent M16 (insulinase) family peptidase